MYISKIEWFKFRITVPAICCWKYAGAVFIRKATRVGINNPNAVMNAHNSRQLTSNSTWWYPDVKSISANHRGSAFYNWERHIIVAWPRFERVAV
jgi:hypothetical protein